MPNLPTILPTHRRHRRRGAHRAPGWWSRPRPRGCLARIAPAVAAVLCVLALVLLAVQGVTA